MYLYLLRSTFSFQVQKFGPVEELFIYYHPVSNKHLGLARVVFEAVKSAKACVEKLNNTSVMGKVLHVFLDAFGNVLLLFLGVLFLSKLLLTLLYLTLSSLSKVRSVERFSKRRLKIRSWRKKLHLMWDWMSHHQVQQTKKIYL